MDKFVIKKTSKFIFRFICSFLDNGFLNRKLLRNVIIIGCFN